MRNILFVEPDYKSKFPPLGLMKLSSYHKSINDAVTFVRGKDPIVKNMNWHRIYVSSLFTWELPRTVDTIKYYLSAVDSPENLIVGGVGATLLPDYIRENVNCKLITGQLESPGILDKLSKPLTMFPPDYSILDSVDYDYAPKDAYFTKITTGCIRSCKFCAVPILEPKFGFSNSLKAQIARIDASSSEKQNLVVMDNNILGIDNLDDVFAEIRDQGFAAGTKRNNKLRYVDFNQGLDCRLIDEKKAELLASICTSPVRLAFDHDGVEKPYRKAITHLANQGLREFTNYLLFNFIDDPKSLYHRMKVNQELSRDLGVRISGFPMRFVPMDDVKRGHVGKGWRWRYLRGMQCILLVAKGVVSPNPDFFPIAFGETYDDFLEILSMPDRYIIWRNAYSEQATDWRRLFRNLSSGEREDFLEVLRHLNKSRSRSKEIAQMRHYRSLIEHYYPGGKTPPSGPPEEDLTSQGLATGYDYTIELNLPGTEGTTSMTDTRIDTLTV